MPTWTMPCAQRHKRPDIKVWFSADFKINCHQSIQQEEQCEYLLDICRVAEFLALSKAGVFTGFKRSWLLLWFFQICICPTTAFCSTVDSGNCFMVMWLIDDSVIMCAQICRARVVHVRDSASYRGSARNCAPPPPQKKAFLSRPASASVDLSVLRYT